MHKLDNEMRKYYNNEIVVKRDVIDSLRERKRTNVDLLKSGLKEYNEENSTSYTILENLEQGSVAMSTLVQSDAKDYDIDVAIVLDKDDFADIGCIATKNIIIDAIKRKTSRFNKEPEALTNCIRIYYEDRYHIDFALFRKENTDYEHCGSAWTDRNPKDINKWFLKANIDKDNKLRIHTRLLKTFSRSRDDWQMPGGLILTVLVKNALDSINTTLYELDDEFIEVLKEVKNQLELSDDILNPINNQSLTWKQKDKDKLSNLKIRLKTRLEKYNSLKLNNSPKKDFIDFWSELFNDDFWDEENFASASFSNEVIICDEDMVENYYDIDSNCAEIDVKCTRVMGNDSLLIAKGKAMWNKNIKIGKDQKIVFYIDGIYDSNSYYVLWKIKNFGREAELANSIRGELYFGKDLNGQENRNIRIRKENTQYIGTHVVDCYVLSKSSGLIVAKGKHIVEIE